MKVIFLDVDGVLTTLGKSVRVLGCKIRDFNLGMILNTDCLLHLKAIIEATGAELVLSSSWRLNFEDVTLFKKWLELFEILPPFSYTPVGCGTRGDEIKKWMCEWRDNYPKSPVSSFVIIEP